MSNDITAAESEAIRERNKIEDIALAAKLARIGILRAMVEPGFPAEHKELFSFPLHEAAKAEHMAFALLEKKDAALKEFYVANAAQ